MVCLIVVKLYQQTSQHPSSLSGCVLVGSERSYLLHVEPRGQNSVSLQHEALRTNNIHQLQLRTVVGSVRNFRSERTHALSFECQGQAEFYGFMRKNKNVLSRTKEIFCMKEEGLEDYLNVHILQRSFSQLGKRNTGLDRTDSPPACSWWTCTRSSRPCSASAGSPRCDLSAAGRLVSWPADPCKSHGPGSPSRSHPQPRNELLSFIVIFITGSQTIYNV